jgi:hypothetical protein
VEPSSSWTAPRFFCCPRPCSGAGAGLSLLDGIVRSDLARGVGPQRGRQPDSARRGWRLDLLVDAVL